MNESLNLPPLFNGLDYMKSTVHALHPDSEKGQLKYAVLHLTAAIEVIAKYRLIQEHWTLVVTGSTVERTTRGKFEAGDFKSVTGDEAFNRLRTVLGVEIRNSELEAVKAIQVLRNKLQHFGLTETAEAIEGVAAEALSFLLSFLDREIAPKVADSDKKEFEDELVLVREGVGQIEKLITTRMNQLDEELAKTPEYVLQCPVCRQYALMVEGDDELRCLFCTQHWASEEGLTEYLEVIQGRSWYDAIKDGDDAPYEFCLECGKETAITRAETRAGTLVGLCLGCGAIFDGRCLRCNSLLEGAEKSESVCRDCWNEVIYKD